jgi:hypothetical protein
MRSWGFGNLTVREFPSDLVHLFEAKSKRVRGLLFGSQEPWFFNGLRGRKVGSGTSVHFWAICHPFGPAQLASFQDGRRRMDRGRGGTHVRQTFKRPLPASS